MMLSFLAAIAMIAAQPAQGATLSDLRWQNRVLVLFADDAVDPTLQRQQKDLLMDEAALAERDLTVIAVTGDTIEAVYGEPPRGETASDLRRRFEAPTEAGFTVVLVGLDGGVKWRGDRPIALADVNAVIDAMPMRRSAR